MRPVMAEDAAHAFVGVDDAQKHAQRGGLASAIRAENAVDRAFGDGYIDPVHRQRIVETLDQPARFYGKGTVVMIVVSRHRVHRTPQ